MKEFDFTAAFIVPTGVGASIGGFAGDASPAVNLISKVCPVVTNPNSVNAAVFSGINDRILYTEGFIIDSLFKREISLRLSKHNKIGVIFDKSIPQDVLNVHLNTVNAVKSVYGLNITDYVITGKSVGVSFSVNKSGISSGMVSNPDTLIEAAFQLVKKGVQAIAVVCYFETPEDDCYAKGVGVDPVGGVEAIISHIITREFLIPVAHAPAFNLDSLNISTEVVNKRAAAEYITPTFLPCVLLGLYNAPKPVKMQESNPLDMTLDSIKVLIMPFNCLGNIPVIESIRNNIPVILVENNKTILNVTAESLNIENRVIRVNNYLEAAGCLLAMREGIAISSVIRE